MRSGKSGMRFFFFPPQTFPWIALGSRVNFTVFQPLSPARSGVVSWKTSLSRSASRRLARRTVDPCGRKNSSENSARSNSGRRGERLQLRLNQRASPQFHSRRSAGRPPAVPASTLCPFAWSGRTSSVGDSLAKSSVPAERPQETMRQAERKEHFKRIWFLHSLTDYNRLPTPLIAPRKAPNSLVSCGECVAACPSIKTMLLRPAWW